MYEQEITRQHRAAFIIAVDQSLSMRIKVEYHNLELEASEVVSIVVGKVIEELILRSSREGLCRDYYDIAVVGYAENRVYSLLSENIEFVPITELAKRDVRRKIYRLTFDSQHRGKVTIQDSVPMWVEPTGWGATPMVEMLDIVGGMVEEWCAKPQNRDSFPPVVFHITDGRVCEADEERLMEAARRIRTIATNDGEVLLVNIHIPCGNECDSLIFPTLNEVEHRGPLVKRLWLMSSEIPHSLEWYALQCRNEYAAPPYRALSYNSTPLDFISMLSIGTRSVDIKV